MFKIRRFKATGKSKSFKVRGSSGSYLARSSRNILNLRANPKSRSWGSLWVNSNGSRSNYRPKPNRV